MEREFDKKVENLRILYEENEHQMREEFAAMQLRHNEELAAMQLRYNEELEEVKNQLYKKLKDCYVDYIEQVTSENFQLLEKNRQLQEELNKVKTAAAPDADA